MVIQPAAEPPAARSSPGPPLAANTRRQLAIRAAQPVLLERRTGRAAGQPCMYRLNERAGFRLERGNARLLVNSKPVMAPLARSARSMIGRKPFTFSVSSHLFCAADQANRSSSVIDRRSTRSATATPSCPRSRSAAAIAG
jgi:hypothetical protein